jgi:hypothetical protein
MDLTMLGFNEGLLIGAFVMFAFYLIARQEWINKQKGENK